METRIHLLNSAEHFARSRGFDAFSYADLAAEVGIRKASIHHHFPRKADLALALIERYRETFAEALGTIAARAPNAGARLAGYVRAYRAALGGGKTLCLCVAFSAGRDSLSDPVLRELAGFHEDGRAWLRETYEKGIKDGSINGVMNPEEESAATLALVEGAQLLARAAGSTSAFDQAVRALTQRIKI
ncbi:MAG: TetR/AcrR family transcriptional regulator [Pseudomonadota bacterium]|nr:TetR/AcrR family transcriptional regulator [Pseudomonadota bacterium]